MATKNRAIYQNNEQTSHENKEAELVQSVQMNIYQSNTNTKDLSWIHFNDEPRVQERQVQGLAGFREAGSRND